MDPENDRLERFRSLLSQIKLEGIGYIPLKKPQLTSQLEKRNRPIKSVDFILLSNEMQSDLGGIDHIIHPHTFGFLVEHPEDFALSKIDEAYMKGYIGENDELFVIFGMHIFAKVSPRAIQIVESQLYVGT